MHWYLSAMRRYATFEGRAPRIEFLEFMGGLFLLLMLAIGIDQEVIGGGDGGRHILLTTLVTLVHAVPGLAVTARRLHDLDRSGWPALLWFVPVLGLAILLLALPQGTRGPNRYGPDPLAKDGVSGGEAPSGGATTPAPFASEATAPAAPSRDVVAELERLAALRASGGLSEDEFATMKARLLQPERSAAEPRA